MVYIIATIDNLMPKTNENSSASKSSLLTLALSLRLQGQ